MGPKTGEPLELSPFVVTSSRDEGYRVTSIPDSSRLATELKDVGAAISIIPPELLGDNRNIRDNTLRDGISDTHSEWVGDWKYLPATPNGHSPGMGSGADPVDTRFAESSTPRTLLFDLRNDPAEQHNAIAQFPDKAAELRQRLEAIKQPAVSALQ